MIVTFFGKEINQDDTIYWFRKSFINAIEEDRQYELKDPWPIEGIIKENDILFVQTYHADYLPVEYEYVNDKQVFKIKQVFFRDDSIQQIVGKEVYTRYNNASYGMILKGFEMLLVASFVDGTTDTLKFTKQSSKGTKLSFENIKKLKLSKKWILFDSNDNFIEEAKFNENGEIDSKIFNEFRVIWDIAYAKTFDMAAGFTIEITHNNGRKKNFFVLPKNSTEDISYYELKIYEYEVKDFHPENLKLKYILKR